MSNLKLDLFIDLVNSQITLKNLSLFFDRIIMLEFVNIFISLCSYNLPLGAL